MPQLSCSNCRAPLRLLNLAGHYQQSIPIDICEACTLIWFEGTESIKLAGPGIADLVHAIHAALATHAIPTTLTAQLPCPVCSAPLNKVFNISRFGRTQQWQCAEGHGYFQTFVLYLAEKGFVRKMGWKDLAQQTGSKRQLYCAGCGAALDDKPHEACPYCRSDVGVIDPARLASAIDIHQAAPALSQVPETRQGKCWSCGGSVDATRESHCSHCNAILQKIDSQRAVAAAAAVEEKVRQNYRQQLPTVSTQKLQDVAAHQARVSTIDQRMDHGRTVTRERLMRGLMVLVPTVVVAAWMLVQWQRGTLVLPNLQAFGDNSAPVIPAAPSLPPSQSQPVAPASPAVASSTPQPVPAPAVAAGPSAETMFSFPAMECAADAKARTAVKIRQIIVVPTAMAGGATGGSGVDNRQAYLQLQEARQALASGVSFPAVLLQYGSPGPVNAQPVSEFFGRGAGKSEVERAAFCLPVQAISPIFKSTLGFHVIQVIDVR